ncbi:CPBP family intramembrane glutamic endopeptidase [Lederbergia wuyishanensis]|uniref:Membrane protease YdiL (CAAX protease family) n=1 Tax=Lederbergia wuyishanensis TaxID=1347903 RepID=A0ABU0D332_9BACI|nr:CPBP family intramembrane glutamic endopeptidase [Lederbergia wuyishanensis]MCJ8007055.1 CPBP family intramembrane metalloprotease [Lederbergia wuyishanensis]MDQ0342801.1 membrane protease YdiL (CAAX protease family) [Lederbergia wuyishanensis]
MDIIIWLVITFLFLYEPIYGYFDYQKFKERVRRNPNERTKYYKKVMVGLWIPTLVILGLVIFGPLTWHDIGLRGITLDTDPLGTWVTYIVIGIAILYTLLLIYYFVGSKVSKKIQQEIIKATKRDLEKSKFADIMPVTKEDKKVWTFVSWTAGITEEIIYRGFLIFAIPHLFPSLSIWAVLIISSIIFGLAHTYQGFSNVVRTSIVGLFFAVLYMCLHSIIPVMLLHFFIDYIAKISDSDET